jgi:hypothetical protein
MSDNVFTLDALIPEPLIFPDVHYGGDGTRHEVRTVDLLGAADYARYRRMQADMRKAGAALEGKNSSEEAQIAAGRTVEVIVDELLATLIPTLSEERRHALPFQYKSKILEWWQSKQPKVEAPEPGEASAGERVTRGRRSPASPSATGSTPSAS